MLVTTHSKSGDEREREDRAAMRSRRATAPPAGAAAARHAHGYVGPQRLDRDRRPAQRPPPHQPRRASARHDPAVRFLAGGLLQCCSPRAGGVARRLICLAHEGKMRKLLEIC